MDRPNNIFDKIGALIPGYDGYLEREARRNCDKILRDSIAQKLVESEKELNTMMLKSIKNKEFNLVSEIEELRKQTNTLMSKIRFAPYGVSSFFGDNQLKENELSKIYQFDLELAEASDMLFHLTAHSQLDLYQSALKNLEATLQIRNNYINEFK